MDGMTARRLQQHWYAIILRKGKNKKEGWKFALKFLLPCSQNKACLSCPKKCKRVSSAGWQGLGHDTKAGVYKGHLQAVPTSCTKYSVCQQVLGIMVKNAEQLKEYTPCFLIIRHTRLPIVWLLRCSCFHWIERMAGDGQKYNSSWML